MTHPPGSDKQDLLQRFSQNKDRRRLRSCASRHLFAIENCEYFLRCSIMVITTAPLSSSLSSSLTRRGSLGRFHVAVPCPPVVVQTTRLEANVLADLADLVSALPGRSATDLRGSRPPVRRALQQRPGSRRTLSPANSVSTRAGSRPTDRRGHRPPVRQALQQRCAPTASAADTLPEIAVVPRGTRIGLPCLRQGRPHFSGLPFVCTYFRSSRPSTSPAIAEPPSIRHSDCRY